LTPDPRLFSRRSRGIWNCRPNSSPKKGLKNGSFMNGEAGMPWLLTTRVVEILTTAGMVALATAGKPFEPPSATGLREGALSAGLIHPEPALNRTPTRTPLSRKTPARIPIRKERRSSDMQQTPLLFCGVNYPIYGPAAGKFNRRWVRNNVRHVYIVNAPGQSRFRAG